jgi:hypothetical protein
MMLSLAFVLCLWGILTTSPVAAGQAGGASDVRVHPRAEQQLPSSPAPATTVSRDGWVLTTRVLHAGTRSQGYHGVLTHDGVEVVGKRGRTLETPLGTLLYQGGLEERPHLWSHSGWKVVIPETSAEQPVLPGDVRPLPSSVRSASE